MDLSEYLGSGSKDYGEKRFDESLLELRAQYPSICKSLSSSSGRGRSSNKNESSNWRSIGLSSSSNNEDNNSSSSVVDKLSTKSELPKDIFKTSKMAFLDAPGNSGLGPRIGKRKIKAIKKRLKESTKGTKWFDMKAPEITDDRKNDLEALRLRGALDTKRFYKRNSVPIKPKHFHVGKIVEASADYYNSRVPKKQRKRTIAEEMMAEVNG